MRKPKVGDKLFLAGGKDCFVTKVGRKYFYVKTGKDSWLELQFYIETWREKTDYTSIYTLYENRKAWEDEKEANKYCKAFRGTFDKFGKTEFTLEQLQGAAKILGIELGG